MNRMGLMCTKVFHTITLETKQQKRIMSEFFWVKR